MEYKYKYFAGRKGWPKDITNLQVAAGLELYKHFIPYYFAQITDLDMSEAKDMHSLITTTCLNPQASCTYPHCPSAYTPYATHSIGFNSGASSRLRALSLPALMCPPPPNGAALIARLKTMFLFVVLTLPTMFPSEMKKKLVHSWLRPAVWAQTV